MDTTALEAQKSELETAITNDQNDIQAKQTELDSVNAQLANAAIINGIESLTDISAVNSALEADNCKWRLIDTTPATTTQE